MGRAMSSTQPGQSPCVCRAEQAVPTRGRRPRAHRPKEIPQPRGRSPGNQSCTSSAREIDDEVARLKLDSLGVRIDELTDQQLVYRSAWEHDLR
jgi:hypothetical protein